MEVLDTAAFAPDHHKFGMGLYRDREEIIHNGKLLHFREIDRRLELPPGTAKQLIKQVALRYGLVPVQEGENIIRFGPRKQR